MRSGQDVKILTAIKRYAKRFSSRLHMPGHKGRLKLFKGFSRLDVTELSEIDNFSVVGEAEKDIAKLLGASKAIFLTGGATLGVYAMLNSVRKLGDKIIVHRSMHKSVFNAVEIFGIEPIIIGKIVVGDLHEEVSVNEIKEALENNPTAIGVFLNAVDYYGRVPDLKAIKELVSSHKKLFLLDNAHGAHLKAVGKAYAGDYADLWVDSAHKTLNTLNQGAIVFSNNKGLEESLVSSTAALSSTSPSYPLLASIEYGVKTLFKESESYKKTEQKVLNLQSALNSMGIICKIFSDGLKLLVDLFASGIKEHNVENLLNKKGVYPELIGNGYVLFMFSPNNKKKDFTKVFTSLKTLKGEKIDRKVKVISPVKETSYFGAKNKCTEYTDLKQAEGKICAENAGVFPPCVPIVFAGEIITKEITKVLENKNVFGLKNGKIKTVI